MFHALAFTAVLFAVDEPPSEDTDAGTTSAVPLSIVVRGLVRSEFQTLPDVVVTVTSPALQGEIVVVTDSLGRFRVPVLPPGTYTVRLEKETYRPFTRTGVELVLGRDADLGEILLLEEPLGDGIPFCGCCPPAVDIGASEGGVTATLFDSGMIPLSNPFESGGVSRSFDTRLRMFPGLSAGPEGTRHGLDPARELSVRLDGVSVREPVVGLLAVPVAGPLVDEAAAVTDAPDALHGGSISGWLAGTTFGGGNEFHGRVFATVTPSSLNSASTTLGDVGAGLGGYLEKDKLWFAVGGQWPWAAPVSLDPAAQALLQVTALLSPDARITGRYVDAGAPLLDHAVRSRLGVVTGNFSMNDKRLLFDLHGWWMGVSDRSASMALDLSSQSLGGSGTATLLMTLWGHHVLKLGLEARSSHAGSAGRDVLSSFLDESWSVADKFTVNLGARTDLQRLRSSAGEATVSGGLLPRLGVVWDPTMQARAKIFAWWGRLEDDVPLALFQPSPQPPALAPGLRPPATESWSVGSQFEVRPLVVGLRYTERRLLSAVAREDGSDGVTVVNPSGDVTRLDRGVTLTVSKPFWSLWTMEASARIQWVRANVLAAALLDQGPVGSPVEAWLPEFKLTAGKEFPISPVCMLQLGASVAVWRTHPEAERLVLSDLEWRDRLDLRLGVGFKEGRDGTVVLSADAFDVFDSGRRKGSLEGRSVRFALSVGF
ncbi:MAG TPA: TonB-dependent receptor [Myxococcaceae bacterium]|nr:TonB-dependent receptor [Myxococcaceae bacterium]